VRILWAAIAYFAPVFAAGFVLGTLRVLVLAPWVGETIAVLAELPVMLALSWVACRWAAARFGVRATWAARLTMGGAAFALLGLAETALAVLAFGRPLSEHWTHYREMPALLGLAGQLAFAIFPALQGARR
jgi:ABC-type uncharacterized transport system permease subunit